MGAVDVNSLGGDLGNTGDLCPKVIQHAAQNAQVIHADQSHLGILAGQAKAISLQLVPHTFGQALPVVTHQAHAQRRGDIYTGKTNL